MTQPPSPLDYSNRRAAPPPPPEGSWISFILGAIAGLAFSAMYYLLMARLDWFQRIPMALFGALIIKSIVGLSLLRTPARRFGIGLFASIPLAVLILVGVCFAALSKI